MGIFSKKKETVSIENAYKVTIYENGNKVFSYDVFDHDWLSDHLELKLADGRAIKIRPGYNSTVIIE